VAGYRSLVTPARVLSVILVVYAVFTVVVVLSDLAELTLINRIVGDPGSVTHAETDASDQRQALLALVDVLCLLGIGVLFLVWFRLAYRNLPALGVESPRFSSGWAVGAWFVPFLNLVRPKQIMDEIWLNSDPLPAQPAANSMRQRVPLMLHCWWALVILGGVIGWIAFNLDRNATTPEQIQDASAMTMVSDSVYLPLTILAYLVVADVTRRQEARAVRLATGRPA